MSTKIKILPVKCGDAFVLTHKDLKGKFRNIIIDGGFMKSYPKVKKQVEIIKKNKQQIDLWILTHLDADHINGAVQYLREEQTGDNGRLIGRFWFNFFDTFKLNDDSPFLSFGKGFDLRKYLQKFKIKGRQDIINILKPIKFGDAELTILSPDQTTFDELKQKWKIEFKRYIGGDPPEYVSDPSVKDAQTIEKLAAIKDAREDRGEHGLINRSSIAFLYEEDDKRLLMLGDSYPSVVLEAIRGGYSKEKPLKVKYMKLSHHGSRKNYHTDLLNVVQCRRFIISSNGDNQYSIPDKEVLAKILMHPNRDKKKKIIFYFSHDDLRFRNLFAVDKYAETRFNFECKFPKSNKVLKIKL
ncbi:MULTISPECIES: ComEC/Rec2 family competence protein [Sphingobacterium]|uniref:ComEC/Rec2 family competence protein n=1 Tax=Sphingobacterium TaxID=28453 RepID=UPI0013DA52E8|nr:MULTISPECIES: MBL fold metallo-hydrolase [unclassified Sphingobacterium]